MSQCVAAAKKEEAILNMNCNCAGPNHFRDRHVFLSLYQQYVRPHLEFAVAAWSPWTQEDIQCLEAVQQRAVRGSGPYLASGPPHRYEDKLKELKMSSLQERRNEIEMVQTPDLQDCDGRRYGEQ